MVGALTKNFRRHKVGGGTPPPSIRGLRASTSSTGNPVLDVAGDIGNWIENAVAYTGTDEASANFEALLVGASTVPYPGAGLPSNLENVVATIPGAQSAAYYQITYGSASPITGVIDQDLANYEINGGAPPASVLLADPQAQTIPSLQDLMAAAGGNGNGTPLPWWVWAAAAAAGTIILVEIFN
jgi:hypothetical protein